MVVCGPCASRVFAKAKGVTKTMVDNLLCSSLSEENIAEKMNFVNKKARISFRAFYHTL